MSSPFERAAAKASAAIDRRFAGSASDAPTMLRIVPMQTGKGWTAPQPDGSRRPVEVIGVIVRQPSRLHVVDNQVGRDFNNALVVRETYATIETSRLGEADIRKGDQLIDIAKNETFEISVAEPHGVVRRRFTLVQKQ